MGVDVPGGAAAAPAPAADFEVDYCGRRHLRWVWRVYNGATRLLKSGVMQVLCFHATA